MCIEPLATTELASGEKDLHRQADTLLAVKVVEYRRETTKIGQ
jgi:hypothetical protein